MLNKDFLSGHYQKTISWSLEQDRTLLPIELPGLIGALCFSGRVLEARKIYKENYDVLDLVEKSSCRFFLGLAYTRKSQYKKASKIFQTNLKSLNKKNSTSLQRFYVYQGIAFYLFFLGKLELSMKWALKSFDSAMDAKDLYAKSLSTDLLAHIKLRLGEINVGLDLLKSAEKLSKKLGNKSVSEAIEVAELQYRAQYGYDRSEILGHLEVKFNQLVSEDNYSRAAIGLELARQYTLRARFDLAEKTLEKISSNIFATENRRQEIQLNLRYAENFYQMGKPSLAWNYLRTARRCLDFEADKSFEIQILGFEYKLFEDNQKETLRNELQEKARFFNSIINHNILSRKGIETGQFFGHEDLLHNFFLSLDSESDKKQKVIESGYLSMLPDLINIKRGEKLFYFDQATSTVVLFYENKIEVPKLKLTPTDAKLLMAILNGNQTKDQICRRVWGYEYDSLRHDNIIYTAMRSLRKSLGNGGSWIETSENGYHFVNDGKFKINDLKQSTKLSEDKKPSSPFELSLGQLNLRQMKSLQFLKNNESLDVASYQQLYNVSDVTASRDLRSLKEQGFVVSVGKARAIKYLLSSK
jgi:hypothetical protein